MTFAREALLPEFVSECEEQLTNLEQGLIQLEARPDDAEVIADVFRAAHTVKGDAHALGFDGLVAVAHATEEVLDGLRKGKLAVTRERTTLLLSAVDVLRAMVAAAVRGDESISSAGATLMEKLLGDRRRHGRGDTSRIHEADGEPSAAVAAEAPRTLRIDVKRLDRMLDVAGEIAIARESLAQILSGPLDRAGRERAREAHQDADRLHAELQEMVTKARMVALGPTFQSFVRTVRDLSAQTGKAVSLVVEGEDVEVDTAVVEQLRAPLTHMVRNAVVHGIEEAAARLASGKASTGTIRLRARHEGRHVAIEVADDGAGLDRARILAQARAGGLVSPSAQVSNADIDRLIFEPSFSTASEVTELSGRGVGMDIVRRNIESVRGSVSVTSKPGEGTTFVIRLPLTVAVIEGFSVGVDADTYVIPIDAVLECVELRAHECLRSTGRGVISLRGEPLPYVRLRDVLGVGGQGPPREDVVVIQHGGDRAGIAVDALHGEGQTVIKPLAKLFHTVRGISGSAILGSGRVAMILDVPELMRKALAQGGRDSAPGS